MLPELSLSRVKESRQLPERINGGSESLDLSDYFRSPTPAAITPAATTAGTKLLAPN